jgi:hypothetical protein
VGALMAIPVAAGLKVVLAERLHARDTADAPTIAPGAREAAMLPDPADRTDGDVTRSHE